MGICNRFVFKITLLIIGTIGFGGIGIGAFGLSKGAIAGFAIGAAAAPLALITGVVLLITAFIGYMAVRGLDTKRFFLLIFLGLLGLTTAIYLIAGGLAMSAAQGLPSCAKTADGVPSTCAPMDPAVEVQLKTAWDAMPIEVRAQVKASLNCASKADLAVVQSNYARANALKNTIKSNLKSAAAKGKVLAGDLASKAGNKLTSLKSKLGNSTVFNDLTNSIDNMQGKLSNLTYVDSLLMKVNSRLEILKNRTRALELGLDNSTIAEMRMALENTSANLTATIATAKDKAKMAGNGGIIVPDYNATMSAVDASFEACKANLANAMRGNMQIIGGALIGFAVVLLLSGMSGVSICCSKDEVEQW